MHLFPCSLRREQLDMITLVTVLLGRVDIIDHAAGFLLEAVGEYRIYLQAHVLLGVIVRVGIDDAYVIFAVDVIKIAATGMHLAPCTVRTTGKDLGTRHEDVIVLEQTFNLKSKRFESLLAFF